MIGAMLAAVIYMFLIQQGYVSNPRVAGGIAFTATVLIMSMSGTVRVNGKKS